MYSKIDQDIIDRVSTLSNKNIDVIVYSNCYLRTKKELINFDCLKYTELPFISGFGLSTNFDKIRKLSNLSSVKFISSTSKVQSLICSSKKFIHAEILNNYTYKNSHSVVIIDTGIFPHIDFCLGRNRVIKFVDLINNESEMYDDNGHGTFVTGILSGLSITNNYSGIDNNVNIIVIKALDNDGETTTLKILEAMQWVHNNKQKYNIKVVCMSFGSVVKDDKDPLISGAEVLWDSGIVVVTAGGNSGPASNSIMSPGACRKVITVGSLDNINGVIQVADFSSRGPIFDYYKPDLLVPGVDIISTNIFSNDKNFYTKMSGTSVSAPMVAGVASRLLGINSNYTPDQIKYMIINSCIRITGDKNSEGYGRLDLRELILL